MSGAAHSTKPPSNGSWLLLLQMLHDRQSSMDRRLQAIETIHMQGSWPKKEPDTLTATGQGIWSRLREAGNVVILAWKLWEVWRKVSWPVSIGFYAWFVAKFFGWL